MGQGRYERGVHEVGSLIFPSIYTTTDLFSSSKTCDRCGWEHPKWGGQKVFRCQACELVMDRQIHGARNIFLRALAEGVFLVL